MTLVAITLGALLWLDQTPAEGKPDPPAATADEKALKRLQKKDAKPVAEEKPAQEDRPTVESRGLPEPEDAAREPDLDAELEKNLGQDLEAAEVEQDPLTKIAENMRDVEELLARMEEEEKSVEIQQKVVRDLEELLKQAENPPPPSPKNKNSQAKGQKKPMPMQERTVARRTPRPRPANPAERTGPPRSARERPRETPEERDVWGHLSDMLRAEMSQYAKENFLAKYRDVIERYYTDISRRSSRDGD